MIVNCEDSYREGMLIFDYDLFNLISVIGLSTTASSSLSSGELLETPPRAPSSPSAASLQLKPEPLSVEMGGKSSSAPLLENNDTEKTNGKVAVSTLYLYKHSSPSYKNISVPLGWSLKKKENLEMNLYYFSFRKQICKMKVGAFILFVSRFFVRIDYLQIFLWIFVL